MSEIDRCQSCQKYFERQNKIPLLLDCGHHICSECAYNQHKISKSINCVQQNCNKVYKINPFSLEKDSQMLKLLEQKEVLEIISLLESQQDRLYTAQKQLSEHQNNFIQQLMQHLNNYVLKDNIALQKEMKKIAQSLKEQLDIYKFQYQQMKKKESQQIFEQQSSNNMQMEQTIQKLISDSQKLIQQNSQLSTNVYEELALIKKNLQKNKKTEKKLYLQNKEEQQSIFGQGLNQERLEQEQLNQGLNLFGFGQSMEQQMKQELAKQRLEVEQQMKQELAKQRLEDLKDIVAKLEENRPPEPEQMKQELEQIQAKAMEQLEQAMKLNQERLELKIKN